jgi:hypothetical protein
MVAIREIAQQFESPKLVGAYFDSYKWAYYTPQEYREHWEYIKTEKKNIFIELETLVNKSLDKYAVTSEFDEIRKLYEHEEEKIIRYCEDMLNDISSNIEEVDGKVVPKFKARELSKKYGFNYTCNLEKQHEFLTFNQRTLDIYKKIVQKLFESYGSLLEGIVTNFCTSEVKLKLP